MMELFSPSVSPQPHLKVLPGTFFWVVVVSLLDGTIGKFKELSGNPASD